MNQTTLATSGYTRDTSEHTFGDVHRDILQVVDRSILNDETFAECPALPILHCLPLSFTQAFARQSARVSQPLNRTIIHHLSALTSSLRPHIQSPFCRKDDIRVMLNDKDAVATVSQTSHQLD